MATPAQPRAAVPQDLAVPQKLAVPPNRVLPRHPLPSAKPAKNEYRRNLPHIQAEDRVLFVTFNTYMRWILPESVRGIVLRHCLHDHRRKLWAHGVIVMPEHVHILRREESVEDVVTYVCENPVRRGLVARVNDYPWLWRDWVEGLEDAVG